MTTTFSLCAKLKSGSACPDFSDLTVREPVQFVRTSRCVVLSMEHVHRAVLRVFMGENVPRTVDSVREVNRATRLPAIVTSDVNMDGSFLNFCNESNSKGESSHDCGRCKGGNSCNATTGDCDEGCEHGWKLRFCNQTEEIFSPLNPDVTQLALPIAASIVAGSFVIGISVGVALYLRRPKDQHHEPDAREQSDAVMVTEVRGDTLQHSPAHAAQTSGSQENVIVSQSKGYVPKKKGNGYKAFPVRHKNVSDPDNIYENEEYEEMV
ncbi:uncharacterized protein LOC112572452 isoform X2 [Pomacea canaliculata]|uniref:uncharacterized protein LOC112572452 isoform X2 n=1 Tax=Pomacea canaliculata TaxID=400727 RepID=UPI000D72E1F3|nr:uncharacterized protein LOC112572452 isoform X2 [Pomacea canaliculata]XP_025107932.1 uncharacterized protein LOC112572452 isoform X2 [Pomacea canaliculata]